MSVASTANVPWSAVISTASCLSAISAVIVISTLTVVRSATIKRPQATIDAKLFLVSAIVLITILPVLPVMLSILDITESSYIRNTMSSQQGRKALPDDGYPWTIIKRRAVPVAVIVDVVVIVVRNEIIRALNCY